MVVLNPVELFQLVQGGFAIVGLVAFTIWIMKWFSLYTARHRDLTAVEQQTRAALKDALDAQTSLGKTKELIFETEIGQLSKELEALNKVLEEKGEEATRLQRQLNLVDACADLVRQRVKLRTEEVLDKMHESFFRAMYALTTARPFSRQLLEGLAADAKQHRPEPQDAYESATYHVLGVLEASVRLSTIVESSVMLVPTLFEEHIRNPRASAVELFTAWANRVARGELHFLDYRINVPELENKPPR